MFKSFLCFPHLQNGDENSLGLDFSRSPRYMDEILLVSIPMIVPRYKDYAYHL